MAHKSNIVCNEEAVRKLPKAKQPEPGERFDRHLWASYIEGNKRIKWCPSVPHGGKAIRVDGISNCDLVEVECTCEQQLCSACSSQAHSPCTCAMWDHWSRKYEAESESIALIRDNTKECPHRKNWRIRYDEIQMLATFLVSQLALVFSIFFVLCSFLCLSLAISCKRTILRT